MNNRFVAPLYRLKAFHCPSCGAYSEQDWYTSSTLNAHGPGSYSSRRIKDIAISLCLLCGEAAVWVEDLSSFDIDYEQLQGALPPAPNFDAGAGGGVGIYPSSQQSLKIPMKGKIVYPAVSLAPMPAEDMPEEIKADYMEAREIVGASPRGAAALLRLCLQKLMVYLGEKGERINDDIASLVRKEVLSEIQQAMDSLRIIGNDAVHPGTINLNDDQPTALALFDLLNYIVEQTITRKKAIANIFNNLPQNQLDAIARRDGKQS